MTTPALPRVTLEELDILRDPGGDDEILARKRSDGLEYRVSITAVLALVMSATTGAGWHIGVRAPASPIPGQGWYDTSRRLLLIWDGAAWEIIGPADRTGFVDAEARRLANQALSRNPPQGGATAYVLAKHSADDYDYEWRPENTEDIDAREAAARAIRAIDDLRVSVQGRLMPSGGAADQVLRKSTGDNYDTEWGDETNVDQTARDDAAKAQGRADAAFAHMPTGGKTRQVLEKTGDADYMTGWRDENNVDQTARDNADAAANTARQASRDAAGAAQTAGAAAGVANRAETQANLAQGRADAAFAHFPTGGEIGQVLTKTGAQDYEAGWTTPSGGSGPESGQTAKQVQDAIYASMAAAVRGGSVQTGITVTWDPVNHEYDLVVTSGPAPTAHTRRIAISADTALTEAEALAGGTSATNDMVVPTYANERRYIFLGIEATAGTITRVETGGFNVTAAFERAPDVVVSGTNYRWWRTRGDQSDLAAGRDYMITITPDGG